MNETVISVLEKLLNSLHLYECRTVAPPFDLLLGSSFFKEECLHSTNTPNHSHRKVISMEMQLEMLNRTQETAAVCVLGSESQNSVSVAFAPCCPRSLTCGFFPGFSVVT